MNGNNPIVLVAPKGVVTDDLISVISRISNSILLLVGVVAVFFIIIGGFRYITSGGNQESIDTAKTSILYAVLGLVVCLISYSAVRFIITQLTG